MAAFCRLAMKLAFEVRTACNQDVEHTNANDFTHNS
jgi:hypothetical protein